MSSTRHTDTVPADLLGRDDDEVEITFDWAPGSEPSGLSGPPENYDPGSADEFYIVEPKGLTDEQEEAVINHLDEHWERPVDDDWPEPDYDPFEPFQV